MAATLRDMARAMDGVVRKAEAKGRAIPAVYAEVVAHLRSEREAPEQPEGGDRTNAALPPGPGPRRPHPPLELAEVLGLGHGASHRAWHGVEVRGNCLNDGCPRLAQLSFRAACRPAFFPAFRQKLLAQWHHGCGPSERTPATDRQALSGMVASRPLVLLVDDEPDLVAGLRGTLVASGFEVAAAASGDEALAAFEQARPAIIVLDLMLPGRDGLDVCRELRRRSDVPVLILTARADDVDRILGLELGADDYLTKPFNSRELVARLRAILRRSQRSFAGPLAVYAQGRLLIDFAGQRVVADGRPVPLTPTEFALLAHLARHPHRVFQRGELLNQVWGYDFPGDLRTVDVHVRRLRQKVESDPAHPQWIRTRFGVGYCFAPSG